jgi:hypothetical protein
MAADTGEATRESAGRWKKSRDLLARGTLPVFTALVSAVLIATFITSREDERHLGSAAGSTPPAAWMRS